MYRNLVAQEDAVNLPITLLLQFEHIVENTLLENQSLSHKCALSRKNTIHTMHTKLQNPSLAGGVCI